MYSLIADKLKNRGTVVYNPFHYGTNPPRYLVPLIGWNEPIGDTSIEEFLISLEDEIEDTLEFINQHSSTISKDSLYFEVDAQESFYCWTADLYFDDLQEAIKYAWIFEADDIYDRVEQEIIYLDEMD
jgi:hypothetical protein